MSRNDHLSRVTRMKLVTRVTVNWRSSLKSNTPIHLHNMIKTLAACINFIPAVHTLVRNSLVASLRVYDCDGDGGVKLFKTVHHFKVFFIRSSLIAQTLGSKTLLLCRLSFLKGFHAT